MLESLQQPGRTPMHSTRRPASTLAAAFVAAATIGISSPAAFAGQTNGLDGEPPSPTAEERTTASVPDFSRGPRGTSEARVRVLELSAPGLAAGALAFDLQSTIDHERQGLPFDRSWGRMVESYVDTGGQTLYPPDSPHEMEVVAGSESEELGTLPLTLPMEPTQLDAFGLGQVVDDVLGAGGVTDGELNPVKTTGRVDADGAAGEQASEVAAVDLLSGVVSAVDAGPGVLQSWARPDQSGAMTRALAISDLKVLGLFDLLGVDLASLDLSTLSDLADRFWLRPPAGSATWGGYVQRMVALRSALDVQAALGVLCDQLDEILGSTYGIRFSQDLDVLGVEPPDCLDPNAVGRLVQQLVDLAAETSQTLIDGLSKADTLAFEDISGYTHAVAEITPLGARPSAQVNGGVENITVGGRRLGGFSVLDALDKISALENRVNGGLDDALTPVGGSGRVRVQLLPRLVQAPEPDGPYATARAAMTLVTISITPPRVSAPEPTVSGGTQPPDLAAGEIDLAGAQTISAVRGPDQPLGDLLEPVTITVGAMESTAEHMRPGVNPDPDPDACPKCPTDKTGKTGRLANLPWDPENEWESPGGTSSTGTLPRTGGNGAAAGLGVAALGSAVALRRRFLQPLSREDRPG